MGSESSMVIVVGSDSSTVVGSGSSIVVGATVSHPRPSEVSAVPLGQAEHFLV